MSKKDFSKHLSQISTLTTELLHAHEAKSPGEANAARHRLLERYHGAIYRYLYAVLGDPGAANDLYHDFVVRLLDGKFRHFDPARGRFRDYVKTVLINLLRKHRKDQLRSPQPLPEGSNVLEDAGPSREASSFEEPWRKELLERAWAALKQEQKRTGSPVHTVLRFRTDHPGMGSAEMAEQLSARLGKSYTREGIRQALHRARERFAELLVAEVVFSLQIKETDTERLAAELIDLGLLAYCRSALRKRVRPNPSEPEG
jgi:RNA polymerase sigma-70 factor (ECF subfamily)